MTTTQIRLLGPLFISRAGAEISLTGLQLRTILTLLAASPGSPVTTDAIMTSLWPENPPTQARKTVQVYISKLRKAFAGGESPVLSVPGGYSLASALVDVDIDRFDSLVAEASATTDDHEEISHLSEAIDLWYGAPFADLDITELRSESARLEEARVVALERRIELRLGLGYHAEVVGELEALALEHPYRERLRAQHMLALYRSGRQADALRAYTRARDVLGEDLGLEPGSELQQLEQDVLAQSADLDIVVRRSDQASSVTVFVSGLEDSEALWEADPEAMTEALTIHDEILHDAVVGAGGHVFKATGDGVVAAMPDVDAAVAAATNAQRSIAAADWPESSLAVRIAIDFGDVEYRDGDYFGPALNRASRVMPSGHGGQVLLTKEAAAVCPDAEMVDLGSHDYKGVGLIGLMQLTTSPEPVSFPELRSERPTIVNARSGFDQTIRGYELRERIDEGDFGIVYRAYQSSVGREVAIKVIRPEYANRPAFIRQFEAEAQVVARIEHPHVVPLYDYWRDPEGAYLVMPWLRGGNLRTTLAGGPLNAPAAMRVLDQVGSALASAHRQGVVHRDIKPANVLLDDEGNAYLSDFGVAARHVGSDGGPLSTSPAYVSPEEVAGSPSSQVSDLYSLGMLAFEILTSTQLGRHQLLPAISELRPELSPAIDQVVHKATAADPKDRYRRLDDFLRAMRQALGADVVATQEMAEPDSDVRNPFRGLRAFQETDAEDFFGRDALIDELVDAVTLNRLVAVVGPSGSGKSSVVRAGLVPRLRATTDGPLWFIADMFPGSYPFEELEGALARIATDRLDGASDELLSDDLGLTRVLKRVLPNDNSRVLLVIDQFEELFSLTTDQSTRERFLASLVTAADDAHGRLHVVLTMRADFFHQPLEYGEFGDLMRDGLVAVAMPTRESLALAISRPARRVGLDLEPGLVTEIVRDVADEPGGLPLMQHALSELFHLRRGRMLTTADYRASGGVLGALTRRADEIYDALSANEQVTAQQIFLRLVRPDENAEDTRRRVRLSELNALGLGRSAVDGVLQQFGQFRLLSFDRDPITRGPTVEVGHEALIREWGLLRSWADDRREDLLLERRLENASAEWIASDRDDSFLLKEGRLVQFEHFADETDIRLTADESEFLERSAEDAARASSRATTRRRLLLSVFAVLAFVASVLAVFALGQRNDARDAAIAAQDQSLIAETQALEATALRYAALADSAISTDPELAIQLALEAAATEDLIGVELPEVRSALYNATFADRLVSRVHSEVGSGFLFMTDGIHQINAAATQGMQPTADIDPSGLFPTKVEIVRISDGAVLDTIEDPSGLSGYGWDPVTGEILTLSLAGELSWLDPESFQTIRSWPVREGAMTLRLNGDLISYGAITDRVEFDLQTHVIDPESGADVFSGPSDAFLGRLSPTGELLAVNDDLELIRVFDIETGDALAVIQVPGVDGRDWDWGKVRDEIFIASKSADVRIVDARTGDISRQRQTEQFSLLSASPDGRLLAAGPANGSPVILDANTLDQVMALPSGQSRTTQIVWGADSTRLVTAHGDGSSILWDIGEATTSARAIPRIRTEPVAGFDFLTDDQLLVTGPLGEGVVLDRDRNDITLTFAPQDRSIAAPVLASPDGMLLARPHPDTSVEIINASDPSKRAITSTDGSQPVAFSRDGNLLLTTSGRPAIGATPVAGYAVHDTETGAVVYAAEARTQVFETATAADFAPDGTLLLAAFRDGLTTTGTSTDVITLANNATNVLVVRDAVGGAVLSEKRLLDEASQVKVSADGAFVAVLDVQGVLRLYDLDALRSPGDQDPELGSVDIGPSEIAISPDDKLIITRADGTLTARLVDQQLRVAWSIDVGERSNGEIRFDDGYMWTNLPERVFLDRGPSFGLVGFPLDRDELIAFAESKLSRELTDDECRQHLGLESCTDRL